MAILETKIEATPEELAKSIKEEEKSKEAQTKAKKRKKKPISKVIWENTKKVFKWIVNFPIYESFLNIFGNDFVFYVYIGRPSANRSVLRGLLPDQPARAGNSPVHHHPQLVQLGRNQKAKTTQPEHIQKQFHPKKILRKFKLRRKRGTETRNSKQPVQSPNWPRKRHFVPIHSPLSGAGTGSVSSNNFSENEVLLEVRSSGADPFLLARVACFG